MKTTKNKILRSKHPAIKVNNLKSAKRLLSRLIYELQAGTVSSQLAKDLTYLLTSYVNVFKTYEMETKLSELEERINKNVG